MVGWWLVGWSGALVGLFGLGSRGSWCRVLWVRWWRWRRRDLMGWLGLWYRVMMMVVVDAEALLVRRGVSLRWGERKVRRTCCVLLLDEMGDLYVIV